MHRGVFLPPRKTFIVVVVVVLVAVFSVISYRNNHSRLENLSVFGAIRLIYCLWVVRRWTRRELAHIFPTTSRCASVKMQIDKVDEAKAQILFTHMHTHHIYYIVRTISTDHVLAAKNAAKSNLYFSQICIVIIAMSWVCTHNQINTVECVCARVSMYSRLFFGCLRRISFFIFYSLSGKPLIALHCKSHTCTT